MYEKLKVTLAMLFTMVFWGISFIWSEQALSIYNPFTVVLFRLIISVVILLVLNIFLRRINKIKKSDIVSFFLLSFLQPFAYFVAENYGIVYTDATTTSVVIATIPLFSPIAAYFFLKERVNLINIIGIIISIIGVFLVLIKDDLTLTTSLEGLLILFGAVVAAVLYSVLVSKLSTKHSVYTLTVYQNLFGIIWFLPMFFIFDFSEFVSIGFQADAFISIALLAVFGSTICFLFFIYGVKVLGITRANIFGNSIPVFTAIFAFFIMGTTFIYINILGIILVILGVTVTQIKKDTARKISSAILSKKYLSRIFPKS